MAVDELRKGAEFASYADFIKTLNNFQQATNSVFVIETSKKIETANKHFKREENKYDINFKYRYVKYICKQYSSFRSQISTNSNTDNSTNTNESFKVGCPVFIKVSAYKSRNCLVILDSYLQHNHGAETTPVPQKKRKSNANPYLDLMKSGINLSSYMNDLHDSSLANYNANNFREAKKEFYSEMQFNTIELNNTYQENEEDINEMQDSNGRQVKTKNEYSIAPNIDEMYDSIDSPSMPQNTEENILRRLESLTESQEKFQKEMVDVVKSEFTSLRMMMEKQHKEHMLLLNNLITSFGGNGLKRDHSISEGH